jgi:hypothetical protein
VAQLEALPVLRLEGLKKTSSVRIVGVSPTYDQGRPPPPPRACRKCCVLSRVILLTTFYRSQTSIDVITGATGPHFDEDEPHRDVIS